MRSHILIPAFVACAALTGCAGLNGSGNRTLDSVHQPVVRINSFFIDADASSGSLSPVELHRISDWLDAMEVAYGDRVALDDNLGVVPRPARDAVAGLLTRKGLILADHAPVTQGGIAPGRVRVVLTRASAHVPGCPDWSTRSVTDFSSTVTSNYGCASNANLAAMVADPTDLVRGQSQNGNDPLTASKAIDAYRAAAPSGAGGTLRGSGTGGSGGGSSSSGGN